MWCQSPFDRQSKSLCFRIEVWPWQWSSFHADWANSIGSCTRKRSFRNCVIFGIENESFIERIGNGTKIFRHFANPKVWKCRFSKSSEMKCCHWNLIMKKPHLNASAFESETKQNDFDTSGIPKSEVLFPERIETAKDGHRFHFVWQKGTRNVFWANGTNWGSGWGGCMSVKIKFFEWKFFQKNVNVFSFFTTVLDLLTSLWFNAGCFPWTFLKSADDTNDIPCCSWLVDDVDEIDHKYKISRLKTVSCAWSWRRSELTVHSLHLLQI